MQHLAVSLPVVQPVETVTSQSVEVYAHICLWKPVKGNLWLQQPGAPALGPLLLYNSVGRFQACALSWKNYLNPCLWYVICSRNPICVIPYGCDFQHSSSHAESWLKFSVSHRLSSVIVSVVWMSLLLFWLFYFIKDFFFYKFFYTRS